MTPDPWLYEHPNRGLLGMKSKCCILCIAHIQFCKRCTIVFCIQTQMIWMRVGPMGSRLLITESNIIQTRLMPLYDCIPHTSAATFTIPSSSFPDDLSRLSIRRVKMVWDRELNSFMCVSPTLRFSVCCKQRNAVLITQRKEPQHYTGQTTLIES